MFPKNFRLHLFIWFWLILSFSLVSLFLIFRASGYIINFKAKTIEKTGLIVISSDPKSALLYLNGKFKEKTPCKLDYLRPGLYHIKIEKDGYLPWEKTEKVEAGQYIKEEAILFLKNPEIRDSTSTNLDVELSPKQADVPSDILNSIPNDAQDFSWDKNKDILLYRTEYEIWLYLRKNEDGSENKIIARFSKPIQRVAFYTDYKHILFVTDLQLRIMEIDGGNDTKLLNLNTIEFALQQGGKEIIYKDNDILKIAKVR